jgi:hypothetical protein
MTPGNFQKEVLRSTEFTIPYPNNGNFYNLDRAFGVMEVNPAISGEEIYLPVPPKSGIFHVLTYGHNATAGGTCKVSIGAPATGAPVTTIDGLNKFATLSAYPQTVVLFSVPATSSTVQWILVANQGAALSVS